jgi:sterol desaturase/sphingolipid hydroxylase (fatty acid hydroxylase superfamily)
MWHKALVVLHAVLEHLDKYRAIINEPLGVAWAAYIDNFSQYNITVFGGWAVMMLTYWAFGGFMLIVDLYKWPRFIWQKKYQADRLYHPRGTEYNPPFWKMLALVLFNQIFIFLPGFFFLQWVCERVEIFPWKLGVRVDRVLPSLPEMVITFTLAVILEEFCFYYSHWLLHRPFLYKHIHKIHHSYKAPHACASLYAHPLEAILGNLIAMNIPLFVCHFHLLTFYVAICLGWMSSLVGHCGFDFPLLSLFVPKHDFHDLHHARFIGNYGTAGWLDRWLGTDIKIEKTISV